MFVQFDKHEYFIEDWNWDSLVIPYPDGQYNISRLNRLHVRQKPEKKNDFHKFTKWWKEKKRKKREPREITELRAELKKLPKVIKVKVIALTIGSLGILTHKLEKTPSSFPLGPNIKDPSTEGILGILRIAKILRGILEFLNPFIIKPFEIEENPSCLLKNFMHA